MYNTSSMASLPKSLQKKEQAQLLKRFPGWKIAPDFSKATVTISFKRHVDAIVFIARLGIQAEVHGHHPEVVLTRAKVKLTTTTNKQLTRQDAALMKHVELLIRAGDNSATTEA